MRSPIHIVLCSLLFLWMNGAMAALPQQQNVPGGLVWVDLPETLKTTSLVNFAGQRVLNVRIEGKLRALVGLALDLAPGEYHLEVNSKKIEHGFVVQAKEYPVQNITLKDQSKVDLSTEDLARVATEHTEIAAHKRHYRALDDTQSPDLSFISPANGRLSGRFGARRIFNGQARAPHSGLDFAAPRGALVRSAGKGQVLAVADYFFNGKTVFVDHGRGLISMYCHLQKITVAQGQSLDRGEPLGLVGNTGRASGPHLHWSVALNGAMINPELFLKSPKK